MNRIKIGIRVSCAALAIALASASVCAAIDISDGSGGYAAYSSGEDNLNVLAASNPGGNLTDNIKPDKPTATCTGCHSQAEINAVSVLRPHIKVGDEEKSVKVLSHAHGPGCGHGQNDKTTLADISLVASIDNAFANKIHRTNL